MSQDLRLGDGFTIPLDSVTSTYGILAKKGAGKSNAAVVMAEAMFDAGVPWVAIDPKGDWWGVRAGRDGAAGLPVVVFGGQHGDVPLEPTAGRVLANLVLEHRLTCVVDVSELTKNEVRRFLDAFGDALYRGARAEPLHVFLEEAHEYLPQTVRAEDAGMVERWQKIVKMGRTKGLGVTIVSQRSAAVNKDVLTQCDTLIVLRTTSPQDRAAVKAWVDVHADAGEALKTLPSLANGEAWVWFPEGAEQLRHVRFAQRRTFDSGATPKVGESPRPPALLADVDLDAIKDAMADTIEKVKADDPKALRAKIVHLEKTLVQRERELADVADAKEAEVVHVEVPFVPQEVLDALAFIVAGADDIPDWETWTYEIATAINRAVAFHGQAKERAALALGALDGDGGRKDVPRTRRASDRGRPVAHGKGERIILAAIAQHGSCTKEQLTVLTGYKRSSRNTYLQRLRTAGCIGEAGERVAITEHGINILGADYDPLPTGQALRDFWLGKLGGGEREILALLCDAYPETLDRDTIGEDTGYKRSSRNTYLQRLRTRELITIDDGMVRASDILFG